jgi:hypothetical protein
MWILARRGGWILASLLIVASGAAVLTPAQLSNPDYLDPAGLAAAMQQSPHFTLEQNRALLRQIRMQQHPSWRTLPPLVRLQRAARIALKTLSSSVASTPQNANFIGNNTLVVNTSASILGLQRETDCSLTLFSGNATFTTSTAYPTFQIEQTTTHYEQVLHTASGLATTPNSITSCTDATLGLGSRRGAYLGKTSNGNNLLAWTAYNSTHSGNALYSTVINTASTQVQTSNADFSALNMFQLTFGDLNGDGIADVIGLDQGDTTLHVWLANANGTLGAATTYALPGSSTEAAVVADVNGDGRADVVVATLDTASGQETISVLTGTGTGTLNAPQSFAVATPTGNQGGASYLVTLVAADFRGNHSVDLIGSNGIMLLNNGSGTFSVGTSPFPALRATSSFGPNMAAGDFNKDGKLDLALNDGAATYLYLGNGDGTFTAGAVYASDTSVGYLAASDLDGDGNLDLWIGSGDSGVFLGDQFGINEGYALMGNGDGTFQGAPVLPFVYTGSNLADLNGDKNLDAVGANADGSFTSYLGDGKGAFKSHSTLITFPSSSGAQQSLGIDTFALGDINGDGKPDLLFITSNDLAVSVSNGTPGIYYALGDGAGGFGTPTFYAVPSTLAASDIDINWTIYNLHVADLNGDGKADIIYNYSTTSSSANTIYFGSVVQLSKGDGTFGAPQVIPYRSEVFSSVSNPMESSYVTQVADLNNDGKPDLIFLAQSTTIDSTLSTYVAGIQVALGKGDGTFSSATPVTGPHAMGQNFIDQVAPSITVADMNGDGVPDIVALGASSAYNGEIAIALGNGDGTFKAPILTDYAAQYLNNDQGIAVGDFNGDGKLDVLVTDYYDATGAGIFLGNGDGTLQTSGSGSNALPSLALNVTVGGVPVALNLSGTGSADAIAGNVELLSQAQSTTTVPAGFSISASSTSGSVAPGQSAISTVTVTPSGGLTGGVSLSCTGVPTGASCGFSPSSVTLGASAATSTLTIATSGQMAALVPGAKSGDRLPWAPGGIVLAGLLLPLARIRRVNAQMRVLAWAAFLTIGAAALHGCGGNDNSGSSSGGGSGGGMGGTPAGTYTIVITATAGTTTHTVNYSLTVT